MLSMKWIIVLKKFVMLIWLCYIGCVSVGCWCMKKVCVSGWGNGGFVEGEVD